jgi:hypothetical protein
VGTIAGAGALRLPRQDQRTINRIEEVLMTEKILYALVTSSEVRFTGDHSAKIFCPVCGGVHQYALGPLDRINECMAPSQTANFVFRKALCDPEYGLFLMPAQYVFSARNKKRIALQGNPHADTAAAHP